MFGDFCVIIPDRGDRPQFTEFCLHQLERMTLKPKEIYHIDYKPRLGLKDITQRVRYGVEQAKRDEIDVCFIVENDDFYPADYFERMSFDGDFVGTTRSIYYHIFNNTYEHLEHRERSSLFNTGFRISALKDFRWPNDDVPFLDIRLWRHAKRYFKKVKWLHEPVGVGIKHGIGMAGGSGHRRTFKRQDKDKTFLQSIVDKEAFIFYQSITG